MRRTPPHSRSGFTKRMVRDAIGSTKERLRASPRKNREPTKSLDQRMVNASAEKNEESLVAISVRTKIEKKLHIIT